MIKLIITMPDGSLISALPSELAETRITIGSGVGSTLVVPHETVAETHVELLMDEVGYVVADLVGGGATLINGFAVEPGDYYRLETGTRIQMGQVEAVYIDSEAVVQAEVTAVEGTFEAAVSTYTAPVVGGLPGSFPLPKHPPGVFVPRKAPRSLWVMASITVTFVAVTAAAVAGYLSVSLGAH